MKTTSIRKICSEIDGMVTWGMVMYGMRQLFVTNDKVMKRYWVLPTGGEVKDKIKVNDGDKLGLSSNYIQ